ncbi:copia protein [Tanacetum coccineum]
MKIPMSSDMKLTKDKEGESVDNTKYKGMIGTTHLGLWYLKGSSIETLVYADSDLAGDYVDRKSTSGIFTFIGCGLTSWFSKKQTALAISTTEAEYVSAEKACQQALWMKQALIDYDIRLEVMDWYPELDNGIYNVVDRAMHPLAVVQACKPLDDDEEIQDEGTSRARTPSPTTYLNSLSLLRHHVFKNPTTPEQNLDTLFSRKTLLLKRKQKMHEEQHGLFKTFGKALKGAFTRKKK